MTPQPDRDDRTLGISRRALLAGAGLGVAAASLGWIPGERIPAARAQTSAPVNFPSGIDLYQQSFVNWAQQIDIPDVWYCAPSSAADVVTLANWAYRNGYRLRAVGEGHNWSPLVLAPGESASNIVLVNLQDSLTSISIDTSGSPETVTVQAGATMNALLTTLQADGYGFTTVPAPGDLTIGGVLAIDGHGSAIQATGETPVAGTTYGSLSNAIQSITIVGWNGSAYALQTFSRTDSAIAPFLTHLGRTIVTEVTLEVGANQNLQCQSLTSIPVSTLFAAPASAGSDSYASLVAASGRVEAIWFPFTTNPWVKIWSRQPTRPAGANAVTAPYNYTFANDITTGESDFISDIVDGLTFVTPAFEVLQESIVALGLPASGTANLWGPSMDVLLYVQPTTLRVTAGGWTILTVQGQHPAGRPRLLHPVQQPPELVRRRPRVADERAGGDPGDRTGPAIGGRSERRGDAPAIGRDPPARPAELGRRRVDRHADRPRHVELAGVLRADGTVAVLALHRLLRVGAARVVQGLGLLQLRGLDQQDDAHQHHPRRHQRGPGSEQFPGRLGRVRRVRPVPHLR